MARPQPGDYAAYAKSYIDLVTADDVNAATKLYQPKLLEFFKTLPKDKVSYRYAPGKWSLKQMLQHIIDAERIFSYRALTFARQDPNALPGFKESEYAENSHADQREWNDLLIEFSSVRTATDLLYNSFTDNDLQQRGVANNSPVTVNALCFISYGHILHHINIIKDRYIPNVYTQ